MNQHTFNLIRALNNNNLSHHHQQNNNNHTQEILLQTIYGNSLNCYELLDDPMKNLCISEIKSFSLNDKKPVMDIYMQRMRQYFIKNHVPIFNSISNVDSLLDIVQNICMIVQRYIQFFEMLENYLGIDDGRMREEFIVFVQSTLFYKLNIDQREYLIKKNISEVLVQYYQATFMAFASTIESEEPSLESEHVIENFKLFSGQVRLLRANFMNSIISNSWISFMFSAIKEKITEVATTDFEQEILSYIQQWKEQIIYPYMDIYFCNDPSHELFNTLKSQVDYFVFENLAKIRIKQIFNMIIDFPTSQQAIMI
ncbi:hypothetical protein C9374_001998 [Naegleria lovaniensis]|uniref:Anaphase-promoting complex subunit 2 TPR repeats domain-containing protein n=1 Tax=Naegleria lovaniensis TaxID=51637 RepID=A0AA88KLT0_NAELO|nr:uncharacterized protein C9374_001998 [Naegleria lovaniensis]KAG2386963.1 hypothetical protein C9374_001998 [Naegleria lovaniensis]